MWKVQRKQPLFLRTLSNWKKYRRYINEYQGTRDDLVQKLLRNTVELGFNQGVEHFEVVDNVRKSKEIEEKERQLKSFANMTPVSLEQMLEEKLKMEKMEEEIKTYVYDPNWKPTFEEITNSKYFVAFEKKISSKMYFKIYHAKDKLVYVGVSVVPGCSPAIMVRKEYKDVKNILGGMFDTFDPKRGEEPVQKPVNIDHVNKAMGNNGTKSDKRIDDIIDGLF